MTSTDDLIGFVRLFLLVYIFLTLAMLVALHVYERCYTKQGYGASTFYYRRYSNNMTAKTVAVSTIAADSTSFNASQDADTLVPAEPVQAAPMAKSVPVMPDETLPRRLARYFLVSWAVLGLAISIYVSTNVAVAC